MGKLEETALALRKGQFVLVYDGDEREGEADLMFHPSFATPEKIRRLRKDAGGLICLAIGKQRAENLGLAFMTDIIKNFGYSEAVCRKTAYGDEPAFSLAVNHRKVYTGITDYDRALTIQEMEKTSSKNDFEKNFYSPGHVFLLIGRGLENRRGHTELGLEIAKIAGLSECIVMCEMLGTGKALSKKDVIGYAKRNGFAYITGKDIYG